MIQNVRNREEEVDKDRQKGFSDLATLRWREKDSRVMIKEARDRREEEKEQMEGQEVPDLTTLLFLLPELWNTTQ